MKFSDAWCVYILSNNAHTLYIGSTNELLRRLSEHDKKTHPEAFTARYTFDRLVYHEPCANESEARAREMQIKRWRRSKKVFLIERRNPNWHDLTPRALDPLRLD